MSIGQWTRRWAEDRQVICHYYPESESTNTEIKKRLYELEGQQTLLVVCDHQTKGKGRGIHSWSDVPGASLLSSWAFSLRRPPQHITSPLLGLAVYRACVKMWPTLAWSLKAPNDIFLGANKVAGILTENISSGPVNHLVIGLGMNVLAAPQVEQAGALSQSISEIDDELTWYEFLDGLHTELRAALESITAYNLSPNQCRELLVALNAYPFLEETYSLVDGEGNLHSRNGTRPWTQL